MVYVQRREPWPLAELKTYDWITLTEPGGVKAEGSAENVLLLGLASDCPATVCLSLVFSPESSCLSVEDHERDVCPNIG